MSFIQLCCFCRLQGPTPPKILDNEKISKTRVRSRVDQSIVAVLLVFAVTDASTSDDGTYLISNSNFSEYLNPENTSNGSYLLIENITLFGTQEPIGSRDSPLSLELDGGGYGIFGVNVTTTVNQTSTGLFGYLVDSWIHRLFLDRPYVVSTGELSPAGALIGETDSCNVTNIASYDGEVRTQGGADTIPYSSTGGVIGYAKKTEVSNCLATGSVIAHGDHAHSGGVVGGVRDHSVINNCLVTGSVRTNGTSAHAGGVVGSVSEECLVSDCLVTGSLRTFGEQTYTGGVSGYVYKNSVVSNCLVTGNQYSDGEQAYVGGVAGNVSDSSRVSNCLVTGNQRTNGTLAYAGGVAGHVYKNSVISDSLVTGNQRTDGDQAYVGGVAGSATDHSRVSNCLVTGNQRTNGTSAYAGGVVGYINKESDISHCLTTGNVQTGGSGAYAGGVVGYAESSSSSKLNRVSNSVATGNVSTHGSNSRAGGVVGYANTGSEVSKCTATGSVSSNGTSAYTGGVVGHAYQDSDVTNCLATGSVTSNGESADAGGVVGFAELSTVVSRCLATGSVTSYGNHSNVGGAVGYADFRSHAQNCLTTGSVNSAGAGANAGGAVGYANDNLKVTKCLVVGNVTSSGINADAGGAVGKIESNTVDVTDCLVSGHVTESEGEPDNPYHAYTKTSEQNIRSDASGLSATEWNFGTVQQFPVPLAINPGWQDLKRLNGTELGRGLFPTVLNDFATPGNDSASLFDWIVWNFGDPNRFPIPYAINPAYQDLKRLNGTGESGAHFPPVLENFASPGSILDSMFDRYNWCVIHGNLPLLRSANHQVNGELDLYCCTTDIDCPEITGTGEAGLMSSSSLSSSIDNRQVISVTASFPVHSYVPSPAGITSMSSPVITTTPTPTPTLENDVLETEWYDLASSPWWVKTLVGTVVSFSGITGLFTTACLVRKACIRHRQREQSLNNAEKADQSWKGDDPFPPWKQDRPDRRLPNMNSGTGLLLSENGGGSMVMDVALMPAADEPLYEDLGKFRTLRSGRGSEVCHSVTSKTQKGQESTSVEMPVKGNVYKEPFKLPHKNDAHPSPALPPRNIKGSATVRIPSSSRTYKGPVKFLFGEDMHSRPALPPRNIKGSATIRIPNNGRTYKEPVQLLHEEELHSKPALPARNNKASATTRVPGSSLTYRESVKHPHGEDDQFRPPLPARNNKESTAVRMPFGSHTHKEPAKPPYDEESQSKPALPPRNIKGGGTVRMSFSSRTYREPVKHPSVEDLNAIPELPARNARGRAFAQVQNNRQVTKNDAHRIREPLPEQVEWSKRPKP